MKHRMRRQLPIIAIMLMVIVSQISACGDNANTPIATTTQVDTTTNNIEQATLSETESITKEEADILESVLPETETTKLEAETTELHTTEESTAAEPETVNSETVNSETVNSETEAFNTSAGSRENLPENTDAVKEVAGQATTAPLPEETSSETTSKQPADVPVTQSSQYTGTISVKSNAASGTEVYTGNGVTIDASNKASGYIMAKYDGGGEKRVKVRVAFGNVNYDYDLNLSGSYEAYPLQSGDGAYTIYVLQNAFENQYAVLLAQNINVTLSNAASPYLYPSQKVNFTSSSAAVKKSFDLCVGLTTEEQKVKAIYDYVIQNVKYDNDKAAQVTSGVLTSYTSNADAILASNKGICLDYATLMAVMLRAQNIPTQVIYGAEASASYHAWNKVFYNGSWVLYDATYGAGGATGSSYTEQKRY